MTVTKDMSISQVLEMHRGTASVFMAFGMQCLGCPRAMAESIQDACMVHGSDPDALVEKLNAYLQDNA